MITQTVQRVDGTLIQCPPKSKASHGMVVLDRNTAKERRRHQARQLIEATDLGIDPGGCVSTSRRSQPLSPDHLYRQFHQGSRNR